ncbi:hypothetical protein ACIBP6_32155 [Nonomuraea terrae]|uniref:hypothetical protein n=1 Tax=Nonomuraea terrae TaxID=2530383 RepID=UPI0037A728A3
MGPVFMTSLLSLPAVALLLISFHDESGTVDTRNKLSGFRTRHTLASREAWDAAHAWLKRPLRRLAGAMAAVLVASVAADVGLDLPGAAEYLIISGQFTLLVGGLLLIGRRADRVAAEVNRQLAD